MRVNNALALVLALAVPACASVTSPVLRPPEGRSRPEISRDMAECEAAATPTAGTYVKAAGTGFLARLLTPFVGLGAALSVAPKATPTTTEQDTKGLLTGAAIAGGIGTAAGIVAGPFVGSHYAMKTVRDATQAGFERCLLARGYRLPPPGGRVPRVVVLVEHERASPTAVEAFRLELERRGYEFGMTLDVELQWWDGPRASAGVFVPAWDIVVAGGAEVALAVQRVLPKVAVVVAGSELDLVAAGLAESADQPGGTVSGLTLAAAELDRFRLELLLTAAPHVKHVAVLANPDNPAHAAALDELASIAPDVTLRRADVRADTDVEVVFRDLVVNGAQAVLVLPDRVLRKRRDAVASLCRRDALPAAAGDVGFADSGGLLESHAGLDATWREAAGFVDRILKGAVVGALPIRTVDERDVILNLRTAESARLTLPDHLTSRATRVIR
jgi:putative tryptophan/tyrosine transport system substrate-binding protein